MKLLTNKACNRYNDNDTMSLGVGERLLSPTYYITRVGKQLNKFTKVVLAGVVAVSTLLATMGAASAATPDDWNIATEAGILTLPESAPYATVGTTYKVGDLFEAEVFTWELADATGVEYRLYRLNPDGSAQKLKTFFPVYQGIAHGGTYVYHEDVPYTLTSGFSTNEYIGVYKYKTQSGATVIERDPKIDIVNTLQQGEGFKLNNNQVKSDFTFFSPTKGAHEGKTGTYKVLSPSGATIQSATFTLGANTAPASAQHTKFTSTASHTTISFAGYLNGTYKAVYSYYAGGTTYTDVIDIVVSGGLVASVTNR